MTTIATDGITIAADGETTAGYLVVRSNAKKIHIGRNESGEPAVFAVAGPASAIRPLMRWVEDGMDAAKVPKLGSGDNPWNMLIIDKSGVRWVAAETATPFQLEFPVAIGAGFEVAIGALDAGANSRRALEITSRRNSYTGGEIQVVNIEDALRETVIIAEAQAAE